MLRALKDSVAAAAATVKLKPLLKDYCDMLRVELDSRGKVLVLEGPPKGEAEAIRVELVGYSLEREDGRPVLRFEELRVSREWMQRLAEVFLKDKRIELPDETPLELVKAFT